MIARLFNFARPSGYGKAAWVAAFLCGSLFLAGFPSSAGAKSADEVAIRAALLGWMAEFNAGKPEKICDLFAADLRYDYRGFPERDYDAICSLLHRSLADRSRKYAYSLVIKEVVVSSDLAAVRLVWTLKVTRPDVAGEALSIEPGLDLFRRQSDGSWKIFRYISYEE